MFAAEFVPAAVVRADLWSECRRLTGNTHESSQRHRVHDGTEDAAAARLSARCSGGEGGGGQPSWPLHAWISVQHQQERPRPPAGRPRRHLLLQQPIKRRLPLQTRRRPQSTAAGG